MKEQAPKGWKELPKGGIISQAGSAEAYHTGDWRTFRPLRNEPECIHCLLCWIYCPDSAIRVDNGRFTEFDYSHCKGCGICAKICPKKCIKMVKE